MWVQNQLDSTVSRIDPTTGRVTNTILFYPGELWPGGILATPTGVWVVTSGGNAVSRIVPATSSVRRRRRRLPQRDAELLADALGDALSGRSHEADALARYERLRNEATLPDYRQNIEQAKSQPAPDEFLALRERLQGDEEATKRFYRASEGLLEAA